MHRLFAYAGAGVAVVLAILSGCGSTSGSVDCKGQCGDIETECVQKCSDDQCKSKCTTDFDNCSASCDVHVTFDGGS